MRFAFISNWSKPRMARAALAGPRAALFREQLEGRLLPSSLPHLLRDISPGATSSDAVSFTDVGGTAFFFANDGVHGQELWRSNGAAAGAETAAQDKVWRHHRAGRFRDPAKFHSGTGEFRRIRAAPIST